MKDVHTATPIRILVIGDSHIGLDFSTRARLSHRGRDFLANLERALAPTLRGEVDIVVHTGDIFDRRDVPADLIEMAMAPLRAAADRGIPVYIVPGNHECGQVPLNLCTSHPELHFFDQPRTFVHNVAGVSIALAGFPHTAEVRMVFQQLVQACGYQRVDADMHVLCMHQAVEGASVGPANHIFRTGRDVVRGSDIPGNVVVVLAGHIHRAQMLTRMPNGTPLAAPVIYPGAVERTSFAERHETKAYARVQLNAHDRSVQVRFVPLPTRPMVELDLETTADGGADLIREVSARLLRLPANAVVQIHLHGDATEAARAVLTPAQLSTIAPETMHITVVVPRESTARAGEPTSGG